MSNFTRPGRVFWTPSSVCLLALLLAAAAKAAAGDAAATRPILVVTAVDNEYVAVRSDLTDATDGILGGRQISQGKVDSAEVVVIRTGWGKAHAAGATAEAIERFSPRIVIMAGTAGSIDPPSVLSGDVVISDATFQYDLGKFDHRQLTVWPPENPAEQPYPNRHFLSDGGALQRVLDALNGTQFSPWTLPKGCVCARDGHWTSACKGMPHRIDREQPRVCVGTTATGDSFDIDAASATQLSSQHSAVSVDMETAAVAEEAADHKLPFVGIRVITDVVGESGGANTYFCLLQLSGARLALVMKRVLSALALPRPGASSEKPPMKCKGTLGRTKS